MDEAVMVAGVGFRTGASADEIVAAVDAALAEHGCARAGLRALATLASRAAEPGVIGAAEAIGVPLATPGDEALEGVRAGVLTHSRRSMEATGFGSAAEAAALAAAGLRARLLGPRTIKGPATCALAIGGAS